MYSNECLLFVLFMLIETNFKDIRESFKVSASLMKSRAKSLLSGSWQAWPNFIVVEKESRCFF